MTAIDLSAHIPDGFRDLENPQTDIPALARNPKAAASIERAVRDIPTHHHLMRGDSRQLSDIDPESIALVVTSPPYWNLKEYRDEDGQLGHIDDYEDFLSQLDQVWEECHRLLVPGGRMCIVVGDVCLSRRRHGRHRVVPLHASIQEHCREIGFDNLSGIYWYKISNATTESGGGGRFLGKPYEPGAVLKNDVEFILMQRKPGSYRSPSISARILSVIEANNFQKWFRQVWTDIRGESTANHPAPFPLKLAERLVRMFSFVGDTVLDPFMGTGTTNFAASRWGRSSVGIEIDPVYYDKARNRLDEANQGLFSHRGVEIEETRGAYA